MIDWKPCDSPKLPSTKGRFIRIDPLQGDLDGADLFAGIAGAGNEELWRFIPFGPPESSDNLMAVLSFMAEHNGSQTFVFRAARSGAPLGMASYMRIRPEAGSAEVGAVVFSKALQKTAAATEAIFLMARHLFDDLGYRRFEWRCDNDNAASRNAATRFGFTLEGVFRQDMVIKGKSRDTAWFAMLDSEWPRIRSAFEGWLAPDNFDSTGQQRKSLVEIRTGLP